MNLPEEKDLAIISMLILGLGAMLTFSSDGLNVVTNIVSAMAGIVTGKALSK